MSAAQGPGSVALTHHWLVRRRGGERVLEALAELAPGAPIYTLIHDPAYHPRVPMPVAIHTSWLQRLPAAKQRYPWLLPLMPRAARSVRLPEVDLVICSDAAFAKAMTPHPRSVVVCYCHSPPRYVWDLVEEYRASLPSILRPFWRGLARRLREADRRAAERVSVFVANSRTVQARIRRSYGRESVVVYPPVDIPDALAPAPRDDYYLCVGHHVPYKRLDLAVAAVERLKRRLVVIGEGPDVARLRRDSSQRVRFLGWQSDEVIREHYVRCAALLFPGEEDFGIVPVEAMAHGAPVIALGRGGATETVIDGRSGVLFATPTVEALCAAVLRAEKLCFVPSELRAVATRFDKARFLTEMRLVLADATKSATADRG